jgi:hypothetical protein
MLILSNAVRDLLDTRLRPLVKREQGMTGVGYSIMLSLLAIAAAHSDPDTWDVVEAFFDQAVRATDDLLYRLRDQF